MAEGPRYCIAAYIVVLPLSLHYLAFLRVLGTFRVVTVHMILLLGIPNVWLYSSRPLPCRSDASADRHYGFMRHALCANRSVDSVTHDEYLEGHSCRW